MAATIDQHHVKMFQKNVFMLAQQKSSLLRPSVMGMTGISGKRVFIDRIGKLDARKITSRHQPSSAMDTPHDRRALDIQDYVVEDLVDNIDKIRMLYDPTNEYAQVQAAAIGRLIDQTLVDSADAAVVTGADESGSETFDTTNFRVAVNFVESGSVANSNLTVGKVRKAKQILDEQDVEPENRFAWVSPSNLNALLRDNTVTSADYVTIKSLVTGNVDTWLGFKFIVSNRLDVASSVRDAYFLHRDALMLGFADEPTTTVKDRPDLINSTQIQTVVSLGAVRREQARIVKVLCDETL